MKDRDIKGLFERLANRGTPRGAAEVLEAAQTRATVRPVPVVRRFAPAIAIAASVTLIGGVAAAFVATRDDTPQFATSALSTVPPSTTTSALPEVSIPAKLIAESRLIPFSNCGTLTNYMRTQGLKVVSAYGLPSTGGGARPEMFAMRGATASAGAAEDQSAGAKSEPAAPVAASAAPSADTYSETNVQEAGIDEPDVVKTDGKRIYALSNGRLFIVDAAQPRILGSAETVNATELFLVGDRVLLFSGGGGAYPVASSGMAREDTQAPDQYRPQARVTVVDVSDPSSIKEVSHIDIDGSYVSARLVDGVARVVMTSYPTRIPFVYPADGSPEAQATALESNRQAVRNAKFDAWVPHYTVTDSAGHTSEKVAVDCDSAYHPPAFSGFGQLSVMSIDPKNPGAAKTTSVAADGQIVYASGSRLYVATTQWGAVQPMADGAMPTVAPPQNPKTLVHDFDISDSTQARYRVSGTVRGTVLNQFSMSEHEGNLRIATTDGNESFVTVFADEGKVLLQIGQVGGLGKNERIYAVRFIGPLGYVVTFRQVDPLYVVDLHVPTKPRVVGELKITGYSAYLHPVGDNLLIGVGQDATEQGQRLGTQVSLFDVSNPAAPKLLQKHPLGQGGSQAEYDHHAFLYWAPRQLAVIPLQEYDPNGGPGFMGAVGMHVVPGEIREVGRVSHSAQYDVISRSLVIGNHLFTFSNGGIKASDLGSLAEQAWVPFPQPQNQGGSSPGNPGAEPAPPKPSE